MSFSCSCIVSFNLFYFFLSWGLGSCLCWILQRFCQSFFCNPWDSGNRITSQGCLTWCYNDYIEHTSHRWVCQLQKFWFLPQGRATATAWSPNFIYLKFYLFIVNALSGSCFCVAACRTVLKQINNCWYHLQLNYIFPFPSLPFALFMLCWSNIKT